MPLSQELMEMFMYLRGIYNIKNASYSLIHHPSMIHANSSIEVHENLLSHLGIRGEHNAMIYENELLMTRDLGNVIDNEIKMFLTADVDWDVLILSAYNGADLENFEGFSMIKKKTGPYTLDPSYIYIASNQFMHKCINNMVDDIKAYVYIDPFLDTIANSKPLSQEYIICKVVGIEELNSDKTKYVWKEMDLSA